MFIKNNYIYSIHVYVSILYFTHPNPLCYTLIDEAIQSMFLRLLINTGAVQGSEVLCLAVFRSLAFKFNPQCSAPASPVRF